MRGEREHRPCPRCADQGLVFETKNYSGKYVCYGDRWFLQGKWQKYDVKSLSVQAKNNASILRGLLHAAGYTVHVNPVIVFHPPRSPTMTTPTHSPGPESGNNLQLYLEPETRIRDHTCVR